MNWDAIAAIGEIVGAGAVLATLAFLSIQIRDDKRARRESNVLARVAASDTTFEHHAEFRRCIASDPEIARIWLAGCADEALDAIDGERFRQLALDYLFAHALFAQRMASVGLQPVSENGVRLLVDELEARPGLRPHWPVVANVISSPQIGAAVSDALAKRLPRRGAS